MHETSGEYDVSDPIVTVVVPTYNRMPHLMQALASIRAQSFENLRIAVFDNASTDDTRAYCEWLAARDPRVVYHRHPENIGAFGNFQYGLAKVDTEYFAFLSDDDLQVENFLEKALAALSADASLAFAATRVVRVGSDGQFVGGHPSKQFVPGRFPAGSGLVHLARIGVPPWTGIVYRTSVSREVGALDLACGIAADIDFTLRHAARHAYVLLDDVGAIFTYDLAAPHRSGYASVLDNTPGVETWIDKTRTGYGLEAEAAEELSTMVRNRWGKGLRQAAMRAAWAGDTAFLRRVVPVLRSYDEPKRHRVDLLRPFGPVLRAVRRVNGLARRLLPAETSTRRGVRAKYPDCQRYLDLYYAYRNGTHPLLVSRWPEPESP